MYLAIKNLYLIDLLYLTVFFSVNIYNQNNLHDMTCMGPDTE